MLHLALFYEKIHNTGLKHTLKLQQNTITHLMNM